MTKICSKCKAEKSLDSFGIRKDTKDGKTYHCKSCNSEESRAFYAKNRDRRLAQSRVYAAKRGPEIRRISDVKRMYNLTPDQVSLLIETQRNTCGACEQPFKPSDFLYIDHDHDCCPGIKSCGKCVRGVLHRNCNAGIGFLGDNIAGLEKALKYLRKPPAPWFVAKDLTTARKTDRIP